MGFVKLNSQTVHKTKTCQLREIAERFKYLSLTGPVSGPLVAGVGWS